MYSTQNDVGYPGKTYKDLIVDKQKYQYKDKHVKVDIFNRMLLNGIWLRYVFSNQYKYDRQVRQPMRR